MRLKLISCEIFYREMCAAVARSPNQVDVEFLQKGLHDIGQAGMLARLQEAVDRVDGSRYDMILLGYGLCNNGIAGLVARSGPIVIPRAHDCITLFFGSHQRYLEYFNAHPGTYFLTSGWLERGNDTSEIHQLSVQQQTGIGASYEELVAKYGQDNAQYLYETLGDPLRNYTRYTFITMGVGPDDLFERQAREKARERNLHFEQVPGDMSLIQRLIDGPWDASDFLVLPPGWRVITKLNEGIIAAEPVSTPS